MLSTARKPEEAVELLKNTEDSQLRQVLALQWFERSLNNMYFHNYEECSIGFQRVCLWRLFVRCRLTLIVCDFEQLVA